MSDLNQRLLHLLDRIEAWLPPIIDETLWQAHALRWCKRSGPMGEFGYLRSLARTKLIRMQDLHCIDTQKQRVLANTAQFMANLPANNVLLTGARGTGKSSLIKACLEQFADQGLRLVEIERDHLIDLGQIIELLAARPERFILFCDDLSFETGEANYKALKSVLDGGLTPLAANTLIYATSNRRHLFPEYFSENAGYHTSAEGEIHPGESIEEKISLSERFGLWLSFYPPKQNEYLLMVTHWLSHFGITDKDRIAAAHRAALIWALERGSRSGRIAWQFSCDYAGQISLERPHHD